MKTTTSSKHVQTKPMEIFQTIQKNMKHEGFIRDECVINKTQMWMITKRVVFLNLQFAYLFHVADTPRQYMDSIFMTATGLNE